ncbi:hypothetical protein [Pseudomonas sp. 25 R 14]|nr:hypothetical protein [Pseudomonas sp. 25 R 14]
MVAQAGFDFAQFDTQATQLDLVIETPEIFDNPIDPITRQVASAVQALTGIERIGHKALGGQPWPLMITTGQANPTQVQLAPRTDG